MDTETELKSLIAKRDKITTGFFWLALKIALIIGLPAFAAAYFGRRLDRAEGTDFTFTAIFLLVAFITSWVIIYHQYKKLSASVKGIEDRIRELRQKKEQADT